MTSDKKKPKLMTEEELRAEYEEIQKDVESKIQSGECSEFSRLSFEIYKKMREELGNFV